MGLLARLPEDIRNNTLGLSVGALGGVCFALISAPLAWLLGALAFTASGTLLGAPFTCPQRLRMIMIAILGVMLGSSFTPQLAGNLIGWLPSVFALLVVVFIIIGANYFYFRRIVQFDQTTAYFCAAPGGLTEMALSGESYGADVRIISLVHATRIMVVVMIIPFYFRVIENLDMPVMPAGGTALLDLGIADGSILIACAVVGVFFGRLARLPAPAFLGPMLLSVFVHITGITSSGPPSGLVAMAQVVLGTAIGCRFAGLLLKDVWKTILIAALSAIFAIILAAILGVVLAPLLGINPVSLTLAFAPGGLAEMSLIALSLGIDTAFVSSMHVLRILLIVLIVPMCFRAWKGPAPFPRAF